MRLIDADKFEVVSWRAQGGREYANGFDDGVDYVVKKIDGESTVDAIPVDWLQKQMNLADDAGDLDSIDLLSWIIQTWQKEQEGR